MSDYAQVRRCLSGCAKRGKCAPRFCPRHPEGGYKCDACRRLKVVPVGGRSHKYATIEMPRRSGVVRHVISSSNVHELPYMDAYGHVHHHHHHHTHHDHDHFPRFAETEASVEAETEAEAESEAEATAETGMQFQLDASANTEIESAQQIEAEVLASTDAELEARASAEAESGYVSSSNWGDFASGTVTHTLSATPTNVRQYRPFTRRHHNAKVVAAAQPASAEDFARNGPVSASHDQDPLSKQFPNHELFDPTGVDNVEPYVAAGSLNPAIPYVNRGETRTTTFSTVPDLLEPRTETKVVYVN